MNGLQVSFFRLGWTPGRLEEEAEEAILADRQNS
jgi:hypothetical protein